MFRPHEHCSVSTTVLRRAVWTALSIAFLISAASSPVRSAATDSPAAKRQLDFANGLFLQGIFDLAASEYEKYLSDFPGSATEEYARYQLGECFYNTRQYEKAMEVYQNLLQNFPQGTQRLMTLLRLGEISYRLEKYDQASQLLTVVLNASPADDIRVMALYYLGGSHLATGRLEEARKAFETQLADHPTGLFSPFSRFNLADTLSRLGQSGEAIVLWEAVVEDFGTSTIDRFRSLAVDALYRLGQTFLELGRPLDAAEAFGQLVVNYPESDRVTPALYQEIWARYDAGQYGEARRKAQMLLEMTDSEDLDPVRAGTLFLIGLCLFEDLAYDQAIATFQSVRQLPDGTPEKDRYAEKSAFQTVWCYFLKGEEEKAARTGERFLRDYPEAEQRGEIFFILGEIRFRQENHAEAADYYQALIQDFPDSKYLPEARYKSAYSLLALGRREEAAAGFQAFQETHSDHPLAPEAMLLEAEAWYEKRDLKRAEATYRDLLEKYPEHDQKEYALYKLGQTCRLQQQLDRAAEVYRQLIEEYPDSRFLAPARFWIAYHADQEGEETQAVQMYEALLEDFPRSAFADEARLRAAMLYYRQDKQTEAAEHFRVLIEGPEDRIPENIESPIYFWTAAVLDRNGEHEKAVSIYRTIVQRFDGFDALVEEALSRLGDSYFKMEEWEQAAEAYDRVLEQFPNGAYADSADMGRARIDLMQHAHEEAITRLKRLQGSPDSALAAESVLLLGRTYEEAGRADEAIRAYLFLATLFDHPEWVPEAYRKAVHLLLAKGRTEDAEKHFDNLKRNYPDSPEVATVERLLQSGARSGETPDREETE